MLGAFVVTLRFVSIPLSRPEVVIATTALTRTDPRTNPRTDQVYQSGKYIEHNP